MPFKLGLQPKRPDPRTLQYRALRTGPRMAPARYSFDAEHPGAVPVPMYANDRFGDCVVAARAHQTLRFEFLEQGVAIPLTEKEVVAEYFAETGGPDSGLFMLDSMRKWRAGWTAGGKRYTIHSFLEVQPQNHDDVCEAMIVGTGVQFGVRLPLSASDQINAGQIWDLTGGPRGEAGSWGGHAILCCEYDEVGPTVVTWGKKQKMTWRWLDAYCDECYLVIDNPDTLGATLPASSIDAALANL